MKILITGSAGFLGYNLSKRLFELGHTVYGLDNMSSSKNYDYSFLKKFYKVDVLEKEVIDLIIGSISPDIIFNLACIASPPLYQKDPINTMMTSVYGVNNILKSMVNHNLKDTVFFQASTSEIYGDPLVKLQNETYRGNVETTSIRSCYDEGKRAAETIIMDYNRQYNLKTRIGRIFNTYGPYMDPNDGRVVSNFINQALTNKPITIYGNGLQTRSICYVDDLIDVFIKLVSSDYVLPINIGNPNTELSVLDLAHKIIELTDSTSCVIFEPLPLDDPKQRCPDISLAKEVLNWEPKKSIEDGLVKTIEYFKTINEV